MWKISCVSDKAGEREKKIESVAPSSKKLNVAFLSETICSILNDSVTGKGRANAHLSLCRKMKICNNFANSGSVS